MLLNPWLLGFVNHVSAHLINAPMDLLDKYTPLLLLFINLRGFFLKIYLLLNLNKYYK